MPSTDLIFTGLFFAIAIAISWFLPRCVGLPGMLIGHVFVVIALFVFATISIDRGTYKYDGAVSMIGLFLFAFVINCALLPVALAALWRRKKCKAGVELTVV